MSQVIYEKKCPFSCSVPKDLLLNKRNLSETEIQLLKSNFNTNEDSTWQNIFVDKDEFDAELIKNVEFAGFAILGKLSKAKLKYHDLELPVGIYNSYLKNVVTGDDNVIKNVIYLENYRLGNRVLLFNIQELSCTNHSKFGNGILKEGEPESNRITIAVGNENEGRCVLPFEQMIPADAYLWSRYRDDSELMNRFVELTEYGNTKKLDTYGTIGDDSVIKNTTLIKDAKIGESAYIKGAFKIKNVTILSSQEEMSQIGEGVELVNGHVVFHLTCTCNNELGENFDEVTWAHIELCEAEYTFIEDDGSYPNIIFPPEHVSFKKYKMSLSFEALRCDEPANLEDGEYVRISFGGSATIQDAPLRFGNDLVKTAISKYGVMAETPITFTNPTLYWVEPLEMPSGNNPNIKVNQLVSNNFKSNTHADSLSVVLQYSFVVSDDIPLLEQWFEYGRYGTINVNSSSELQTMSPNLIYNVYEVWSYWGNVKTKVKKTRIADSTDIDVTEGDTMTVSVTLQIQGDND